VRVSTYDRNNSIVNHSDLALSASGCTGGPRVDWLAGDENDVVVGCELDRPIGS
jgi:hypothetical protein